MKIYVADDGDTLRTIAKKNGVQVLDLIFINPHIASPDQNIAGRQVIFPASARPDRNQANIPPCPPAQPPDYLDHWIPLTPLNQMAKTEYDVIIVGTGAGGGSVLWRLCEQWGRSGKRIGVVEAGDLLLQTHAWNIPTFDGERGWRYFSNPKVSIPIGNSLPEYSGARNILTFGGKTLFWGLVSPRMHITEFAGWPVTVKEMEKYYNIAEQVMDVNKEFSKGSSITEILLERLRENGFPDALFTPLAVDLEPTNYGEFHSNVAFSSILFFARALNLKSFDLAVKARAVQVLTEDGGASGVRVMTPEKNSYIIKAKTVVLAANAFETPRILLNSGIPGKAIGHYLTNHSFITANGFLNTKDFPEVLGTLDILIPYTEDLPYQLQLGGPEGYQVYHYKEKPRKDEWDIGFYGAFGKVESRFENRVSLDPVRRDEYGVPPIQVHFSYSEKDQAVIRQMGSAMRQASSVMGIRLASENGQPEMCLRPPGADFHESGTCRMGYDPSTSATNQYGQIHGISGLYIADNSVLPSNGAANPTLTTVALAIRSADHIIEQLK
ncbi:GMC oxidoreductase [Paenibacillus alkaliterrae]|uniref:GMC oxidoreductase n=1 Tax=Paenibacillus alkaliterrae TaxID=320909 RepID=UPI002E202BAB